MEIKETKLLIFLRGNLFSGHKLNDDGSIIYTIKTAQNEGEKPFNYADTEELVIESCYDDSIKGPYDLLRTLYSNGDIINVKSYIDDNGIFHKEISKVTDKEFCKKTQESWNKIRHHWFVPEPVDKKLEEYIN